MDIEDLQRFDARIAKLERRVRVAYAVSVAMAFVAVVSVLAPAGQAQENAPKIVRARAVIIEDELGRDRIVIGAPVPNPREGQRRSRSTGMVINDAKGYERFGLGLREDGTVGMGFDAPRGTGDDRNRERINIVAAADGGAYLRFLNRKTEAAGFLRLNDDDTLSLDFLDFKPDTVRTRSLNFGGERTTEQKKR